MTEDAATIENRLNRLWLEAGEMAKKWQPIVVFYVTNDQGLAPWDCDGKIRDKKGRLINIRNIEKDDSFATNYFNFQSEFFDWDDTLQAWLSTVSPRFRRRFNEVFSDAERFSKQYDEQYSYVGEVSKLLTSYDDFCKKKAAVDDLIDKIGSDGWTLEENDDIAFELIQVENGLDRFLCVRYKNGIYKVHLFRDSSDFESALIAALDDDNKAHRAEMNASKFQSSISKLKIPQKLRKLMIKASKQSLMVKPQITYGDLRRANLDDTEIIDELNSSLEKLELA